MTPLLWIGFIAIVLVLLAVDLRTTGRHGHALTVGEALAWTSFYVALALIFNGFVYFLYEHNWLGAGLTGAIDGREASIQFFTAWVLEKSLSVDNIFVIALIFSYFGIKKEYQHRILFWGILGALVFRGALILAGSELLRRFEWTAYIFGAILIVTAVNMLVARHDNLDPDSNFLVRLAKRRFPIDADYEGPDFLVRRDGRTMMGKSLVALLLIESFDLLFAIDSVPAALAVTTDPFLVFTSNIFAVLGLRALYFVLAGYMDRLRYLKASLVFLLAYVGVKMMLSHSYPIPNLISLAIIAGVLTVGVGASLLAKEVDTAPLLSPLADHLEDLGEITRRHATLVIIAVVGSTGIAFALFIIMVPTLRVPFLAVALGLLILETTWMRRWLTRAEGA